MSVFQPGNVAYGLSQALIGVPNAPILSQRAPTANDRANIGTIWIDQPNNEPFIITSVVDNVANWVSMDASGSVSSIVTDAGTATPVMGVINLLGGANIVTSATGDTIHVAVTDNINLPATNAAGTQGLYELGGLRFAYAYPPSNTFLGITAGNTTLNSVSAVNNTGIGNDSLQHLTLGSNNTGVGAQSLIAVTTGINNVAAGYLAGDSLTTGDSNVALGNQALEHVITGNDNIAVGFAAGTAYTSSESSNIVIGSTGVVTESNVIRIGTQGTGAGEQDACAIAGIYGATIGATNQVVFVDDAGFLGGSTGTDGQVIIGATAGSPEWATLTAGTNISITNGANSITIDATSAAIEELTGDNSQTASGLNVTIAGGSNINTAGDNASTMTIALDNNVSISGDYTSTAGNLFLPISNLAVPKGTIKCGTDTVVHFTSGSSDNDNVFVGRGSGNGTNNGGSNVAVGSITMPTLTSGSGNTAIGGAAINTITSGGNNTGVGNNSLSGVTTGGHNTAVGNSTAVALHTGSYNCFLGDSAGSGIAGAQTSNICIMNTGVFGTDNNKIRIGTQGTGNGQQNSCFIAGIGGVTPGGTPQFVIIDPATGELGSTASGGGGITTIDGDTGGSATSATITFDASTACGASWRFDVANPVVNLLVEDTNFNIFMGGSAGNLTGTGDQNIGIGHASMLNFSTAVGCVGVGYNALINVDTSQSNTAIGRGSMETLATGGGNNTCVGDQSLGQLVSGSNNIALGSGAGSDYIAAESNNILIGNTGNMGNSNEILIGDFATQTTCFIAGIAGVTVANSAAVLIDTTNGQLGTVASSRRYKENIEDMEDASNNLMNLRPVVFNYKNDPTRQRQYGLIAEEVDVTFPSIVTYNKVQDPETVRYHDLPVLLLNELQKQHNIIASLMRRVEYLENKRTI